MTLSCPWNYVLIRFRMSYDTMNKSDFIAGVRAITPALPPNIPFGILFGATAVEVGIGPFQAVAMSLFVFAGAAQMAAVDLIRADAALSVILATVLILNLRYMIYGASLAPDVRHLPLRWRAVMGYALSDINYGLAISKIKGQHDSSNQSVSKKHGESNAPNNGQWSDGVHEGWYYLGLTVPFVLSFSAATAVGAFAGMSIGNQFSLEFAIPLIFISLLAPSLKRRVPVLVAVLSGIISVLTIDLPYNTGLLVAVAAGVCGGMIINRVANVTRYL